MGTGKQQEDEMWEERNAIDVELDDRVMFLGTEYKVQAVIPWLDYRHMILRHYSGATVEHDFAPYQSVEVWVLTP